MKNNNVLYHLLAIFVVAVWGVTFVNSKVLLHNGMTELEIFFVRFVLAYFCIWTIAPRKLWSNSWKDELIMVVLGITGGSLYFIAENFAVGKTYVNNVSFIVSTSPVLTILIAASLFKEAKANARMIVGSLIALLGVAAIIFNGQFVMHLSPIGDLLALSASICWAIYSLLIRGISARYNATFITRKVFFYGVLTSIPMFIFYPWQFPFKDFLKMEVWGNIFFLSVIAAFLCYVLWSYVINKLGALKTSNYVYLSPITTVIASAIILDEKMTLMSYIGSALILIGVYWANSQKSCDW
ncbi:MAG: DMT family transporter [Prevotellaceae bacterium]|nr:DMT family transporter [Prevotella sp.]MDD7257510.1 DMT family transporter [Prevotellaceae bacterium]MDY6130114.1 DMT family transporter [Prevotella sp.]